MLLLRLHKQAARLRHVNPILQDADEFLADPGTKRLNFNQELKDLELQRVKKQLIKVTEEYGNLI